MALAEVMHPIIGQLKADRKFAAVHIYRSVEHSVQRFARQVVESGGEAVESSGQAVEGSGHEPDATNPDTLFQAGTLKAYEEWLRSNQAAWSTVSTYVRTLRAVYNRIVPPDTVEHNPKLFADVHTKVDSYAKRAIDVK